ncbi:MAG: hypothetical protein F6K28_15760 [Microcoleus sp. SIO2G3]|nr:hypothetical protein [Microcoleus sp. SIO2G3]
MSFTPAKQVIKLQAAFIRLNGLSVTGSSAVVTSALNTALSTAGDGSLPVPLQPAGSTGMGVLVAAPRNLCKLYAAASDDSILADGVEIYGKLTEASGVYTLSFFTLSDAGVEAAYSFSANTSIDIEFAYRFDFWRLPSDAIIGITTRSVGNDPAAFGARRFPERLTITATNTLPNLSKTPISAADVELIINGISYDSFGGNNAFFSVNVDTKALTWSQANAGIPLDPSDRVIARYLTNE